MTVLEQTPIASTVANGSTTVFPHSFKVLEAGDLLVRGQVGDTYTTFVLGVDYVVTGLGTDAGAVTFVTAPPDGMTITRTRRTRRQRLTDYQQNAEIPSRTLNLDLDRLVLMAQEAAAAATTPDSPTDTLRFDLSDNTSGGKGAGMVGFGAAVVYAAGTVGAYLRNLAASGGSALVGFLQAGTGAVSRTLQSKARDVVSVKDFGAVGDNAADDTAAIQAAINYASNNGCPVVFVPVGRYLYTRLYTYYDAALNPGFNAARMGRIRVVGEGRLQHGEANLWPGEGWHGSILISTATSGDCFNMSPASADGGFYPGRENGLENITLIGNTPGFVLRHHCAINSQLRNVTVLQLNVAGSGVYWHSAWFTNWDTVWITNRNTTGQTGVGVDFGATLFAGSFRFADCVFERFRDGFQINDSIQSVCLLFDGSCTFQSNARDGLQINAAMRSIVLDTPYLEFNGRSHVRCTAPSGGIQSLSIRGGFALGGTDSASTMTDAMIYVRGVTNWSIDGLAVFRPWTDVVDVGYFSANGTVGAIKNVCVDASDNTPASVIYLARTDDQRAMPVFEGNSLIGSTQVKEYNDASYFVNSKHALFGVEAMAWTQPVLRQTLGLNQALALQSATTPPLVVLDVAAPGSLVAMPGLPGQGRQIVIASQATSAQTTSIRQVDGTTVISALAPGQALLCWYEPTAAKWIAVGPLVFTGL